MNARLAALLSLTLFATVPAAASVDLSVDAGLLTNGSGTPIADGDLVLIIASPSGIFSPTVGSEFVSGDNLILGSSTAGVTGAISMDSLSSGTAGETYKGITFDLGTGATGDTTMSAPSVVAGDQLAIRWYTNFTLQDFENGLTPTSGFYGTYTTSAPPDGGGSWVVGSDNSAETGQLGLLFLTQSDGGSSPDIQGEALTPVISGDIAVPEPSTYALLATGLLFLAGAAVRRKRLAVVVK